MFRVINEERLKHFQNMFKRKLFRQTDFSNHNKNEKIQTIVIKMEEIYNIYHIIVNN